MQTFFASVARDACLSEEIALELAGAEGIPALVGGAQKHYDNADVQAAVAGALRNLSDYDECALDVATADGLEMLVDAFARHRVRDEDGNRPARTKPHPRCADGLSPSLTSLWQP